ncbi:MAG: hypothetical protein ACI84D_002654, partial [Thalassolituus oleivorans]
MHKALPPEAHDARLVAHAMALHWVAASKKSVLDTLKTLDVKSSKGTVMTGVLVSEGYQQLESLGWLPPHGPYPAARPLLMGPRKAMYREILRLYGPERLEDALMKGAGVDPDSRQWGWRWPFYEHGPTVALVRLRILSGATSDQVVQMAARVGQIHSWDEIWQDALESGFDPDLYREMAPEWRARVVMSAIGKEIFYLTPAYAPVMEWVDRMVREDIDELGPSERIYAAMVYLFRGDEASVQALVGGMTYPEALSVQGALLTKQGKWKEAKAKFESGLTELKKQTGTKSRLVTPALIWLYPLSLLAQQTPVALRAARKFAAGEAGSRKVTYPTGWHLWTHAADFRLGEAELVSSPYDYAPEAGLDRIEMIWRCLLRTWVGRAALRDAREPGAVDTQLDLDPLLASLEILGYKWLTELVETAVRVYRGEAPPANYFARGQGEQWRTTLDALRAIPAAKNSTGKAGTSRLLWAVWVDGNGKLTGIEPLQQKTGKRGWLGPKVVPLSRMVKMVGLEPVDAAVARTIRPEPHHKARFRLDLSMAIRELVGHPRVVMGHDTSRTVDVVSASVGLDVVRDGTGFRLVMHPEPPAPEDDLLRNSGPAEIERELTELDFTRVDLESASRLRVIYYTPEQRRVANLLKSAVAVPEGQEEALHAAMRSLASHFDIQSDTGTPAEHIVAASGLRAEVSPLGSGITVRLVAAPLGPDGPRLTPGLGRSRLLATVNGQAVATQRDLAVELNHMDQILDHIGFMDAPLPGATTVDWDVEDPDQALSA